MSDRSRYLPWVVVGFAALYLLVAMVPPSTPAEEMQLEKFGALPVVDGGRVKPVDTYVRTHLMILSSRQDYKDSDKKTQPAVRWMLNIMAAGLADYYRSVSIPDGEVRAWLGLPDREGGRFRVGEIVAGLQQKPDALARLKVPPEQLKPVEQRVIVVLQSALDRRKLTAAIDKAMEKNGDPEKARVFRIDNDQLIRMLGLEPREGLRYDLAEFTGTPKFTEFLKKALTLRQSLQSGTRDDKSLDVLENKVLELYRHLQIHYELAQLGGVLMVPASDGDPEGWETLGRSMAEEQIRDNPSTRALEGIVHAYATGDVKAFNKEVDAYQRSVSQLLPGASRKVELEEWFNHFAPFYQCTVLYVLVALLTCLSWVCWRIPLQRSAFALMTLTLAVHTVALVLRMYIQGRPPVTNLYSSAVFIGWGCVLLCLVIEYVVPCYGISLAVGSLLTGFPTMLIAHHLGGSGDTLEMMQAVLDTNFWLATHVVCVTLGYTATFFAGAFGLAYIFLGLQGALAARSGGMNLLHEGPKLGKVLGQIIYGIVCFATLLSFVGTVLGGIWADESWGRFWGWDPKENGALLIVIMNSLILHARWGGMVKDRGMALLTIVGNMVTMWSWFGTNQLGVGLHAYGFNKELVLMCRWFWVGQLVMLGAGLLPLRSWYKTPRVLST